MKRLFRSLICVITAIAIYCGSFSGSYFYFEEKVTKIDLSCFALFSDGNGEYYLQKAPGDIAFYITNERNTTDYTELFELTDFDNNAMQPVTKKVNPTQFKILPPVDGYVEGKRYTIKLEDKAAFSGDELKKARILVFSIEKAAVSIYKYNETVVEINDKTITPPIDSVIAGIGADKKVGDILLGKDSDDKYTAYKITELLDSNGTASAKVEIPAVDEIFDSLEVYGEYRISPKDIIANPDLNAEVVENVRKSGFFNNLMTNAYAAEAKKDAPIDVKFEYKDDELNIEIKFTIKAGDKGLFGIAGLKGHQVEITLTHIISTTITPNIDGVRDIDISQKTNTSFKFGVTITMQENLSNDGEPYDRSINKIFNKANFKDLIAYKEYVKTITDTMATIASDKSQGEIKLFDWAIPIPAVPCLTFGAEVDLKLEFGVAGEFNIGKDFKFQSISGVTFKNNEFKCYSNIISDPQAEDWTLSLTGKFNAKLGLIIKIKLDIINEDIAEINLDPQGGLYVDIFVTFPIKVPTDLIDVNLLYSYLEAGAYFELNINAYVKLKNLTLNIIDNIEYSQEIAATKIPLIKLGNDKIASGMIAKIPAVKVNDKTVTPPDILFSFYDVKKAKFATEVLEVGKLKFSVPDNSGLSIKSKIITATGVSAEKYAFVTATYLHTDGKNYSAIFKVLLSGSMIEGKVSKYSSDNAVNPVADAKVNIYKANDTTKLINSVKTDVDGKFTFNVDEGEYSIAISADGYHTLTSIQKVGLDEIKYTEHILLIDDGQTGDGTAGGIIKNAINGNGISSVTINLRKNWNNRSGEFVDGFTTTTSSDGSFAISGIPVGYYTVEATKNEFYTDYCNLIVQSTNPKMDHNFTLSPILPDDYIQVVLRWGQTPSDLDSHLIGKTPSGGAFNVYYSNKNYKFNNEEYANLDVDDTSSYGPETITIMKPIAGNSIYAVHDYSNKGSTSSEKLSYSGAYVTVFKGGKQIGAYNIPTGQIGTYWVVFQITSDGRITPINTITNNKPK